MQNSPTHQRESSIAITASMYVAFAGGILTPVLETIRRWHQLADLQYFINWFDDYLIGGFLVFAAWKTFQSTANGQKYLIAAWGFATGMAFYSFFGQLQSLNRPDPAPVSSTTVVFIKGVMLMTCIVCLWLTLKPLSKRVRG
jgi:hypothetical protein